MRTPIVASLFIAVVLFGCQNQPGGLTREETKALPNEAWKQDFERTKNLDEGRPTPEKLLPVLAQIKSQLLKEGSPGDISTPWIERGPNNVGGRTRAIMFDPNDATGKKVWSGGVTGGLWSNSDITEPGTKWEATDDFWDNLSVTCMAYDPNNTTTFYVGTGESFTGASRGAGIWKSTDGGNTWNQLGATSSFYYVNDIVVRDESGTSVVYAGVTGRNYEGSWHGSVDAGLQRSTDGGASWSQVLPNIPGESLPAAASDLELDANNILWVGTDASPYGLPDRGGAQIYKSSNGTSYSLVYTGSVTNGYGRVELACAPSDANYVYAIIEDGGEVDEIIRTTNAGTSWSNLNEPSDADNDISATDFSRGQAGYDLIACVNPTNRDDLMVGAVNLFRSTDGGTNWNQISKWSNNPSMGLLGCSKVHADQHAIVYRPGSSSEVVFGTDGGIFYCDDITDASTSNAIQARNNGYNVTQFYAAAIHPDRATNIYLAGSQDNGTQQFKHPLLSYSLEATGGDGAFCFIDENEGDTMITSYIFNNYYISYDGGNSFSTFTVDNIGTGSFINPAAYDSEQNILYANYSSSAIMRKSIGSAGTTPSTVAISLGAEASALSVSPHTTGSTTLFIGTESGDLFKVTNADGAPSSTNIGGSSFPSGSISCVAIGGSEDTLAVTFFNYGVSSVWFTSDGGSSWSSKEGNLPDMPIRWFMFNPNDYTEAIVATELGVWSTQDFDASSPEWQSSNSGLATVRVDMLQIRESDQEVIAATFGRGLFSSYAFSEVAPEANFSVYSTNLGTGMSTSMNSLVSGLADSVYWSISPSDYNFLEGTDANSTNPVVQFIAPGSYQVSLYASNTYGSDTEVKAGYINVSEAKSLPYSQDFDAFSTCSSTSNCSLTCSLSEDWFNATTDNTDWRTYTGSTPSTDTGPSDDVGGGGNYLYIEASSCFESEAITYSPPIDLFGAGNPRLSFSYFMYGGIYMGSMKVFICHDSGEDLVWQQNGYTPNSWQSASVDLSDYSGQKVVLKFYGLTGTSYTSDIAIDEVSVAESNLIRWDGGGITSNWSEAENWSTDQVPGAESKVILDNTYTAGSYSINLASETEIYSLEIDMGSNTVSLSGGNPLNVTGIVTPSSGSLASNGQLTLKAESETKYGQVATGSGSITGNVINEWYFAGRSGYRHISSPVSCTLGEITNDFSRLVFSSGSDGSIWSWDASISNWDVPVGSGANFDEALAVFLGTSYNVEFSPLPFRFDASGALQTGNQSQLLSYSVGDPGDFVNNSENAGWNFLMNPYPSILDWDAVTADAGFPAELSTTVYYWDESVGTEGSYASYNATTGTRVNGGTAEIAKGNAAWVQLNSDPGGGNIMLNLNDAMRSTGNTPKPKTRLEPNSKIRISAQLGANHDELHFARFHGASTGYDHLYDHLEMDNAATGISLYSGDGKRYLAYNCLGQYRYPLPFSIKSAENGICQLSFAVDENFMGERPRYLKNLQTNEIHPLSDGGYQFNAEAGEEHQFVLMHFQDDDQPGRPQAIVKTAQGMLIVQLREYAQFNQALLFELNGKLIQRQDIASLTRSFEMPIKQTGVYVLLLQGDNGNAYSQKVIALE